MVNAKHIPALLLLLAATLASCVYDNEPALRSDDGRQAVQVTFTLAAGNAPTDTRATWGDHQYDSENIGTAWERAIDPDDLHVLLYTAADNGYVGRVENLVSFRNDDGTYTYYGQLTADSDDLTSGTEYKIMVFANCDIDNNTEDISSITKKTFAQNANYIPLWGVKTTPLNLTPGTADNLGDIDLLRAMAKVEVTLSDALTGEYTLGNVSLNRYNQTGYCLPEDYDAVSETKELDREDGTAPISFNPKASVPSSPSPIRFQIENGRAVCYLPEYEADDTKPAQLTITLAKDGNKTKDYTLDLKDYNTDNGGYYDLVRNHIYRYTITGVNDGTLKVQYRVQPWELVTSSITYGDIQCELLPEGGDSGDAAKGDPEAIFGILHKPTYAYSHNFSVLKPGTAGATYEFTLTAPEGAVWTAHLSNNKDFYFSDTTIDTDNDGTKETKMVSTGIARAGKYYIQINATNPWQEIKNEKGETLPDAEIDFDSRSAWGAQVEAEHRVVETYFYITILADGDMQEKELEINPTLQTTTPFVDNRRFPGTATRIWIRQVPAQKGRSGEDQSGPVWNAASLAANVNPTDEDFQWWRVNPYWGTLTGKEARQ